jgi:toxin CcdB
MAKHDVYALPDRNGYLLDVQTDLLDAMNTRVVVPLFSIGDAPAAAKILNPIFEVDGEDVVMITQFMAAIHVSELKNPVTNLSGKFAEITRALDMVFQVF